MILTVLSLLITSSNRQQQNRDRQQTYCLNKRLKSTADFSAAQANLCAQHQLLADTVIICVKKGVHTEMDLYSHGRLAFVDDA